MLHFIILNKSSINFTGHSQSNLKDKFGAFIPNHEECKFGTWTTVAGKLLVLYWVRESDKFKLDYYINSNSNQIELFSGWCRNEKILATKLKDRSDILEEHSGEYVYIKIDKNGNGKLLRNKLASFQVYYCQTNHIQVISSRCSLVNCIVNHAHSLVDSLEQQFIGWMLSTSWAQDNSSLFKNILILKQTEKISWRDNTLKVVENPLFTWRDLGLSEWYRSDPKSYWDNCYEILIENLNFYFSEFNHSFKYPLSGGKDSRLLLGLIMNSKGRENLLGTITNGTPYSGEVISAKIVSDELNINHEINTSTYIRYRMDDKFARHIYFTEGEVSPMDLTWNFKNQNPIMILRGQEVSLRNIATINHDTPGLVKKWFYSHFNDFNILGVLKASYAAKLKASFLMQLENSKYTNEIVSDWPNINRMQTRFMRWGARIWNAHNTNEFSPFIFLDFNVLKFSFNSGAKARINEEFHYEMLSRCGNNLHKLPFYNQVWSHIPESDQHVIDHFQIDHKPLRGSHAVFQANFDEIKQYILSSNLRGYLDDMVNWEKLHSFSRELIKPGHYQPFWNFFQIACLSNSDSFQLRDLQNVTDKPEFPVLYDSQSSTEKHSAEEYSRKLSRLLLQALTKNEILQMKLSSKDHTIEHKQ